MRQVVWTTRKGHTKMSKAVWWMGIKFSRRTRVKLEPHGLMTRLCGSTRGRYTIVSLFKIPKPNFFSILSSSSKLLFFSRRAQPCSILWPLSDHRQKYSFSLPSLLSSFLCRLNHPNSYLISSSTIILPYAHKRRPTAPSPRRTLSSTATATAPIPPTIQLRLVPTAAFRNSIRPIHHRSLFLIF